MELDKSKKIIIEQQFDKNKNIYRHIELDAIDDEEDQAPSCTITEKIVAIPVKYLVLVILVIQTSTNILGLHYSRTVKKPGQIRYLSSTAIWCAEVLKLVICYLILLYKESFNFSEVNTLIKKEVFQKWKDTLKVSVPALLFVVQNNLLFLALTELDAVVYQVTYQLKILTTAVFSVVMLGRKLLPVKWISLLILLAGVCLVQIPADDSASTSNQVLSSNIKGVLIVLLACVISGFSGVYFEKILKGSPVSVWMRNIQLALFSIIIGSCGIVGKDLDAIRKDGFFQGYNAVTVFVVCSQGLGGLLIALVVKYADNILKGFATSLSIIISTLISYFVFQDFVPTQYFFVGAVLVVFSTWLYGRSSQPQHHIIKK